MIEINKELYGWSSEVEKFLTEHDQSIPKGTFTIQTRSGKFYWYFNRSSGSPRLLYLCSVDDKGNDNSSFRNSVSILKKKINNPSKKVKSVKLVSIIDSYINDLDKEGKSNQFGVERTKKTTQDLTYHMRTFREYVLRRNLYLSDCVKVDFGNEIISYVSELNLTYKPNTVRRHLTTVKLFLNDLVQPKSGAPLITSHPITSVFLKRNFSFKRDNSSSNDNFYSEELYSKLFELCAKKVRSIWIDYLKNGIDAVKTSDLVYFVSLLQLNFGFRISEIMESYLEKDLFNKYYSKKGGYSYLEKNDDDDNNYSFHIVSKKIFGKVYVDYTIFSWDKPPDEIPNERLSKDKFNSQPYVTNIIEVMIRLFSNKKYLISMDLGSYYTHFREIIVKNEGFGKLGISKPHDLRKMCINYLLYTKGSSPFEVAQLTRHKIQTMENHYIQMNNRISAQLSEKFKTKGRYGEVRENMKSDKSK